MQDGSELDTAMTVLERARREGRPVVGYTTGVYDMFHVGHLNLLRRAASECDRLIVGVTTDELAERTKAKWPVVPFEERAEIVASIRFVAEVVAQDDVDKFAAWPRLRYDRLFVGDDHRGEPAWVRYEQLLAGVGAEVVYFPYTANTSSTLLRERLLELPALA